MYMYKKCSVQSSAIQVWKRILPAVESENCIQNDTLNTAAADDTWPVDLPNNEKNINATAARRHLFHCHDVRGPEKGMFTTRDTGICLFSTLFGTAATRSVTYRKSVRGMARVDQQHWYRCVIRPSVTFAWWLVRPFERVFQSISGRLPERGRKKNERREKKCPNNPHPHLQQAQWSLPYSNPN